MTATHHDVPVLTALATAPIAAAEHTTTGTDRPPELFPEVTPFGIDVAICTLYTAIGQHQAAQHNFHGNISAYNLEQQIIDGLEALLRVGKMVAAWKGSDQ